MDPLPLLPRSLAAPSPLTPSTLAWTLNLLLACTAPREATGAGEGGFLPALAVLKPGGQQREAFMLSIAAGSAGRVARRAHAAVRHSRAPLLARSAATVPPATSHGTDSELLARGLGRPSAEQRGGQHGHD